MRVVLGLYLCYIGVTLGPSYPQITIAIPESTSNEPPNFRFVFASPNPVFPPGAPLPSREAEFEACSCERKRLRACG